MGFAEQFEVIRKDRMGVVSSEVYPGIKELVSEIYPDEAHFIYELLQNAEDANATEVLFKVESDMLIFRHNGNQFDEADIRGITNIGASTKRDNYVQAGKFGIGFKSVYAFTETPLIYCDTVNFKIEKLLLPTIIEPIVEREHGWTEFHFPFDSPKISAEEAKIKIKQGLLEIENTTLLFLNNIHTIVYVFENGDEHRVEKAVKDNMVIAVVRNQGVKRATSIWKRFSKKTELNGKQVTVDIAFPMEGTEDKGFRFVSGEDKVCISFLAKKEKSNLKFYLNAPFGCTPLRDSLNENDKANPVLINELAMLAQEVIGRLKEEDMLTDDFFNVLPIADDEIPSMYQPIVNAIYDVFRTQSNLPTMNGSYVTVGNGIMSSRNVIDKVFRLKDVQVLFDNSELQFVKNRPVNSRAYKFLKQLDIEELTPLSVLRCMMNMEEQRLGQWLSSLDTKQLEEIYSYLYKGLLDLEKDYEKYEEYERYNNYWYARDERYKEEYEYALMFEHVSEQLDKIKELKIVKSDDGLFYSAGDVRLLVHDITVPEEYKLVCREVLDKKDSIAFLRTIGVAEFTEKELEKYYYGQEKAEFVKKVNAISNEDDPLEVARMILSFFEKHEESEINFGETKYVWTRDYVGNGKLRRNVIEAPKECYLDMPYIEETGLRFAESIHKKKSLSNVYMELSEEELDRWIEFLKRRGIYFELKVEMKRYNTGYSTGFHHDYMVNYLQQYISLKNPVLNRFIWSFFVSSHGWNYSYEHETIKKNRNYSIRKSDSSIVRILKASAWVLDVSGKLQVPVNVSEKTIAIGWKVDEENGFLDVIGFGEEQKKIDDEKRKKEELERLQQENKQEAAELLGFESAEAVMQAREWARMVAELGELGIDLRELYESKKKEKSTERISLAQQLKNMRENEFRQSEVLNDGEVFGVPNEERRRQKLKDSMADEKQPEKKDVFTKKSVVNQEEKHFVGTEYSCKCQICFKVIYKKDGSRHYVAMNLLDTGHLEEEYLTGLSTGWNTLCLCPNCAAEFKFGAISMYDFEEKVRDKEIDRGYRDFYEFEVQMQGEQRKLHYTPKHLLALKAALEYFDEVQEAAATAENNEKAESRDVSGNDVVKDSSEENKPELNNNLMEEELPRKVIVVRAGDRCPNCGTPNAQKRCFPVIDVNGVRQNIEGRRCACGINYLTRKQWNSNKICVSAEMVSDSENVPKVVKKKVEKLSVTRCPKCGLNVKMFAGKGMCWECYKEEMSARFE